MCFYLRPGLLIIYSQVKGIGELLERVLREIYLRYERGVNFHESL